MYRDCTNVLFYFNCEAFYSGKPHELINSSNVPYMTKKKEHFLIFTS
jgi:hypothetical protein